MEHKIILGGEEYLPFARSCITKLKATGLAYANQSYEVGGVSIKVRIEPGHEYIRIEGGSGALMVVRLTERYYVSVKGTVKGAVGAEPISVDADITRYKRWIYRLDSRDPMSSSKAKLLDFGESSERLVGESHVTTGPEDVNWQGIYDSRYAEGTTTMVTTKGKYGCAQGEVMLFDGKVAEAGTAVRTNNYDVDDHTIDRRIFTEVFRVESMFKFGGWSYPVVRTFSMVGFNDPDYLRNGHPQPNAPAVATGMGVKERWMVKGLDADGAPVVKFMFSAGSAVGRGYDGINVKYYSLDVKPGSTPVVRAGHVGITSYPPRATIYTKDELQELNSGRRFILRGYGLKYLTRKGVLASHAYTGGWLGESEAPLISAASDARLMLVSRSFGKFQLASPDTDVAGKPVGSLMDLSELKALKNDAGVVAVLASPEMFTPTKALSFLRTLPPDQRDDIKYLNVSFVYDGLESKDVTEGWN